MYFITYGKEEIYNAKATGLSSFSPHLPRDSFAWIGHALYVLQ